MNLLARFKRTNEESDRPSFAGKTLVIYINSEHVGGGVFQDVKLVRIGFCEFIVGRRVGLEPLLQQRWSGASNWIAIHEIAQMIVFDDIEAAKRAFQSNETEAKPHQNSGVSNEPCQ